MGFKKRKLSLVLQVKAAEPQSSIPPKNSASTSSKPRRISNNCETEGTPAHGYDPLYVDSSGEEDHMEDIQPFSLLSRPAGATAVTDAPSDCILTRCFNELLKVRNEVSWMMMYLDSPSISVRSPS